MNGDGGQPKCLHFLFCKVCFTSMKNALKIPNMEHLKSLILMSFPHNSYFFGLAITSQVMVSTVKV